LPGSSRPCATSRRTRLAATHLLMVTGDSGSGKSSLVRARLVPRWRGGALAELKGRRPDEEIWHVIETRPGSNPRRALGDAVFAAAKRLGESAADCGTYKEWATSDEAEKVRDGLRTGRAMFFNSLSPRSPNSISILSRTWRYASSEIQSRPDQQSLPIARRVYRVRPSIESAPPAAFPHSAALPLPDKPSIAVFNRLQPTSRADFALPRLKAGAPPSHRSRPTRKRKRNH
jgi:hypothetical protein